LVSADDVHMLGKNIYTIKKNTESLVQGSRKVGLDVDIEMTKYMVVSSQK